MMRGIGLVLEKRHSRQIKMSKYLHGLTSGSLCSFSWTLSRLHLTTRTSDVSVCKSPFGPKILKHGFPAYI